jgi:hypothetical protein
MLTDMKTAWLWRIRNSWARFKHRSEDDAAPLCMQQDLMHRRLVYRCLIHPQHWYCHCHCIWSWHVTFASGHDLANLLYHMVPSPPFLWEPHLFYVSALHYCYIWTHYHGTSQH